jgi:hypothetical protein
MATRETYELVFENQTARVAAAGSTGQNGAQRNEDRLVTRNPAPDASEPSVPNGTYREIKIGR